jgi:hypothetical protein
MRSLAPLLLFPALFLASSAHAQSVPAQTQAPTPAAISPVEVTITGPRLIHRGDALKFHVMVTNHSDAPIALRFPRGLGDTTRLDWKITYPAGRTIPPYVYNGPVFYYCPVVSGPSDEDILIVQPHQTQEYPYAGDPSDYFVFPGKGFYRVSLNYVLDPTYPVVEAKYRPPDEPPSPYTPRQKLELLRKMPHIEVTSNVWQLYLTD